MTRLAVRGAGSTPDAPKLRPLIVAGFASTLRRNCGHLFTAEIAEDAEMKVNGITEQIIGAAIEVHRALGPGLLESAYLLINFNVKQLTRGLRRLVNELPQSPLRSLRSLR